MLYLNQKYCPKSRYVRGAESLLALNTLLLFKNTQGRIGAVAWPAASLKGSILVGTRGGAVFDLEVH